MPTTLFEGGCWSTLRSVAHAVTALVAGLAGLGVLGVETAESPMQSVPSAVVELQREPTPTELSRATQVVVLGTGTPIPDAHRAGPSIAVIDRGNAYLFDVGAGSVRNATVARYRYDIPALYPLRIRAVFFTHLHSDHTVDFPELAFTLWWRRTEPLLAFGPEGTEAMTTGMYAMMGQDIRIRNSGSMPTTDPQAYRVQVRDVSEGVLLEEDGIRVEAFSVDHGDVKPAYGYRVTTRDKVVVISGDTTISGRLREMARGADLLFHEVISDSGLGNTSQAFQSYHRQSHTLASELGRLASDARPGLLVLYHGLFYGVAESSIVDEVRATYDGPLVLANDLDIF